MSASSDAPCRSSLSLLSSNSRSHIEVSDLLAPRKAARTEPACRRTALRVGALAPSNHLVADELIVEEISLVLVGVGPDRLLVRVGPRSATVQRIGRGLPGVAIASVKGGSAIHPTVVRFASRTAGCDLALLSLARVRGAKLLWRSGPAASTTMLGARKSRAILNGVSKRQRKRLQRRLKRRYLDAALVAI